VRWLEEMLEHAYSKMTIILVGNKKDLESQREVSYNEGAEFARKNKLIFFETSAKTSENVDQTFIHATKMIFNNIQRGDIYDLANESIGIKPGNALPPAHGRSGLSAASRTTRLEGAGGVVKKEAGCC
jgi:GTPase SAR1 family protein